MASVGALIAGIAIGALLIFGTLYASGSFPAKTGTSVTTSTVTNFQTITTTLTVTTTSYPSGFSVTVTVSSQVTSCSVSGKDCVIILTNSGTSGTAVTSCSIQNAGTAEDGILSAGFPSATYQVPAGGSESLTCTVVTLGSSVGSQAVGTIGLVNGGQVPFSGNWTS